MLELRERPAKFQLQPWPENFLSNQRSLASGALQAERFKCVSWVFNYQVSNSRGTRAGARFKYNYDSISDKTVVCRILNFTRNIGPMYQKGAYRFDPKKPSFSDNLFTYQALCNEKY